MYYPVTIAAIRGAIKQEAPTTVSQCTKLAKKTIAPLSYLLWMCDEVERMDYSSPDAAFKAARWIGWVLAHAELRGLLDNNRSRDLVREDKQKGFDAPHR